MFIYLRPSFNEYRIVNNKSSTNSEKYLPSPYYILKKLKYIIDDNKDEYILIDFGCGMGRVLKYFEHHHKVKKLIGIESNKSLINCKLISNNIEIIIDDCKNLETINNICKINENTILYFYYPFSINLVNKIVNSILNIQKFKVILCIVGMNHLIENKFSKLRLISNNKFYKIFVN